MIQPDFVFRGHQAAVNSVCFFGDDRLLVSGDQDGHLIVWNMMLKRQLAKATGAHTAPILAVCGLGTDTVVSQGRDNRLCVWALDASEFSGELRLTKTLAVDSMNFCKFSYATLRGSPWIVFLVSAGAGEAGLFDVASGEQHSLSIGHQSRTKAGSRDDSPMCVKLVASASADGVSQELELFVGYESTMLQQFSIDVSDIKVSAALRRSVTTAHSEPVMSLDYDSQRQLAYTCAADNKVCCYTADGSKFKEHVAAVELKNSGCSEIRCFPALNLVAVASWDYATHLFTSDLEPTASIAFHRAALTSVDVSTLSTAGADGIVDEYVRQRWSSRSRWMAVASRDSRISLWDIDRIIADARSCGGADA
ncbi:Guanine nucleotide binding protein (G protein), beta polypeptide 1-like [Coemansia spiralis]|uniref:ASTRA-associated protein 1 n=1 Tax=Coemansia spiralis TaxID=417178 RepID=A0A9W8GDW8_9FUNG|nr:Guanine nucleotide binding protein (G protein), beta polypeptide 1-like [Coemansia spiralis]